MKGQIFDFLYLISCYELSVTNSTKQRPSREYNGSSAGQEIACYFKEIKSYSSPCSQKSTHHPYLRILFGLSMKIPMSLQTPAKTQNLILKLFSVSIILLMAVSLCPQKL